MTYPDHDFWLQTCSDRVLDYVHPTPEQIDAADMARALSHLCRFGGHAQFFYSVAQHSVLTSYLVPPEDALSALLHDGQEAFVVDVPRPLKRLLGASYAEIEGRVEAAVAAHFGLTLPHPPSVKEADNAALLWEGHVFAQRGWFLTQPRPDAVDAVVAALSVVYPDLRLDQPWTPEEARAQFLRRLSQLLEGRGARALE